MDRFLGKQVGAYRLVRRLGVGGMAAVYLGEPLAGTGGPVAIKILHRRLITDGEIVRRFLDEAQAANRIAHPGIVRVFYCGRDDVVGVYLVLELLAGQTLAERRKERGSLPAEQVLGVLEQVAAAMQVAHRAGVIHRDLKASNIFVARDPTAPGGERVKVLDFGVAKLLRGGAGTRTGYVVGTFSHMPPEQMLDAKTVDARADVYALGAMGYFLLTGRPAQGDEQIDRFLLGHPLPRPTLDDAPPRLARVILRALEHERTERYPTMAAFAAALREAQQPESADATKTIVAGPAPRGDTPSESEDDASEDDASLGGAAVPRERTLGLEPEEMAALARSPAAARQRRSWTLGLVATGVLALGLGALIGFSGTSLEHRNEPARVAPPLRAAVRASTQVTALAPLARRATPQVAPADAGPPPPASAPAPVSMTVGPATRRSKRARRPRSAKRRARALRRAAPPRTRTPARPMAERAPPAKKPPRHLDTLDELKR